MRDLGPMLQLNRWRWPALELRNLLLRHQGGALENRDVERGGRSTPVGLPHAP